MQKQQGNNMNKNQKGFTLVEGLLVIIALTLVGFTGFYVYNANKKTDQANLNQTNALDTQENLEEQPGGTIPPVDDRLVVSEQYLPFTFKYPRDWKKEVDQYANTNESFRLYLRAPNTEINEEGYANVVTGAEIRVYKDTKVAAKSTQELKTQENALTKFGSNAKDIKVDGVDAVEYDVSYEGPPTHHVQFIKDSASYTISIQKNIYEKPQYQKIFQALIESIDFK